MWLHALSMLKINQLLHLPLVCSIPVPSRAWSHIALDFVTDLPPTSGTTVILTVVDRFSKAVHFNPLPNSLTLWRKLEWSLNISSRSMVFGRCGL